LLDVALWFDGMHGWRLLFVDALHRLCREIGVSLWNRPRNGRGFGWAPRNCDSSGVLSEASRIFPGLVLRDPHPSSFDCYGIGLVILGLFVVFLDLPAGGWPAFNSLSLLLGLDIVKQYVAIVNKNT
jgi:hypothetical protein